MPNLKLSQETNHITSFNGTERIRAVENISTIPTTGYIESGQLILSDGWTPVNEAWTYNAANKFNAPTDATTRYQKGDKLRWKDGGAYKYGVLITVAATLLTIATNTDYVIANAAITDIAISRVEFPFGWCEWFNYTPTLTGFSVNPTGLYRYKINGCTVSVTLRNTVAGTSNDTVFTVTAPVAARTLTNAGWSAPASVTDNGAAVTSYGRVRILSGETAFSLFTNTTTGAWTNANGKAVTDAIIVYEM